MPVFFNILLKSQWSNRIIDEASLGQSISCCFFSQQIKNINLK